ncbi:hypothetical protein [Methylobacterium platani]|uniref:Uncharacterized protein n=2 Tax=Methylobacterium platani TaxID=427683 RepID=A0A179SML5_9HYPH|nr:hypothetical protein [Methylobacterium platani]KMO16112.1 hypothetical protein SQ03_15315 [Methylobacterium platani JCM 14648]OAS27684.1 hypothetical protein A5481_00790 [Methylobacterium platani]
MRQRTTKFSPNRKIVSEPPPEADRIRLANEIGYGGNPEHKRHAGDFDLNPPAQPRLGKTLCDDANIHARAQAIELLREGARRGLISVQAGAGGRFPKMIWAVTEGGVAMEAQIENPEMGIYHGYPMPKHDPLEQEVHRLWIERAPRDRSKRTLDL